MSLKIAAAFAALLLVAVTGCANQTAAPASAPAAATPAPPPQTLTRLNATIVKFDAGKLELKSDKGGNVTVAVNATTRITRSRPGTIADVKPGQFIGCTAVEGPDHKLRATEIHIIPESLRGMGEGHYPWGDQPNQTMTNGNVESLSGVTDGHVIKVSYKGGISEIEIPPGVKVTIVEVVGMDALKPGVSVGITATGAADKLTAVSVRL